MKPRARPTVPASVYVDVNRSANGSGNSASDPTNVIPAQFTRSDVSLLFNSDNGTQRIPSRDNGILISGNNVRVSSYGSGRATVSAYETVTSGWTRVGTSQVWWRPYAGGNSGGSGPLVGNVIDLSHTAESSTGDVLDWENLEEEGDKVGVFRANPGVLAARRYAYDWVAKKMYVNVGSDPNAKSLGISCVGRFLNTADGASPGYVTITNLRVTGFARSAINIREQSHHWKIFDTELYANGGMYNVTAQWYHGSGITLTHSANNHEIYNNTIVQTYDSPITAQHFGGSSNGHLRDIKIHHNTIDRWALGAVELSDFGTNNRFSRITIEDNVAVNGGKGFSRTGDFPQGTTDGIPVRGGAAAGSQFTDLVIRRNAIDSHDACLGFFGSNYVNPVIIEGNTLKNAAYGISNKRSAQLNATGNVICGCQTPVLDPSGTFAAANNTILATCP